MSNDYLRLRAYLALHGGHMIGDRHWLFRGMSKAEDILQHAKGFFDEELLKAEIVTFGQFSSSIIIFNEI